MYRVKGGKDVGSNRKMNTRVKIGGGINELRRNHVVLKMGGWGKEGGFRERKKNTTRTKGSLEEWRLKSIVRSEETTQEKGGDWIERKERTRQNENRISQQHPSILIKGEASRESA